MDYPLTQHEQPEPLPWRAVALVAAAIAVVELLLLIVVGGALIAKPDRTARTTGPASTAKHARHHVARHTSSKPSAAPARRTSAVSAAELPRRRVSVMVLNGNGVNGAAAAAARRIARHGYRIGIVTNAPRGNYTRSLVMYRRGYEGEGIRLAHDLGVKIIGPIDGLRPAQMHGAQAVLVVGS